VVTKIEGTANGRRTDERQEGLGFLENPVMLIKAWLSSKREKPTREAVRWKEHAKTERVGGVTVGNPGLWRVISRRKNILEEKKSWGREGGVSWSRTKK